MKKIFVSLAIIGIAAAVVVGATSAYFSDVETSRNNTITSGALDLTLNGYNNATEAVVIIEDMKPCQTWYSGPITLRVYNNPGRIYKHIVDDHKSPIVCEDVITTEPECDAEGGCWNPATDVCISNKPVSYLPEVTWIDIERWEDFNKDGVIDEDEWVIMLPDHFKLINDPSNPDGSIASHWMYLGTYGYPMMTNELVIRQSFHMDASAGNEYQADRCTFAEEFMVMQTNAGHPTNAWTLPQNVVLDSIDVGDSDSLSMVAHNAQEWFDDPGIGNYGARDGNETIAMIGGDDDGNGTCDANESEATFEMNAGVDTANKLIIRHLDGSANDSFDVYVGSDLVYSYVGNQFPGETWTTTAIDLATASFQFTGQKTITLDVTTGYPWGSCPTYGQGAVNWAKITN